MTLILFAQIAQLVAEQRGKETGFLFLPVVGVRKSPFHFPVHYCTGASLTPSDFALLLLITCATTSIFVAQPPRKFSFRICYSIL